MIHVVIPTRGRPGRAAEVLSAIRATATQPDTRAWFGVDRSDPLFASYVELVKPATDARFGWSPDHPYLVTLADAETGNLVRATNSVSMRLARMFPRSVIANWGDDHVPRTEGWDAAVSDALTTPGIAYGDDGLQGQELPTAPFISSEIVTALGYYFLPDLEHMYVDNAVRDIGAQTGTLRYLPEVSIEHMHPSAGKADWDDAYIRVNAELPVRLDRLRYESWREHAMAVDVGRVRHALGIAA